MPRTTLRCDLGWFKVGPTSNREAHQLGFNGGHPAPSPTPTSLGDTNVPLETSAQETFVKMASAVLYTKW